MSIYDKPTVLSHVEQINFLLRAEGIDLLEIDSNKVKTFYEPNSSVYKSQAKLFVKDGKFVLAAGSIIKRPIESSKNWNDEGKFYNRYSSMIEDFISEGKVEPADEHYKALVNLSFNSPSMAASFVSGRAENGWAFFKGLEKNRS